jgi:hypothetical protein
MVYTTVVCELRILFRPVFSFKKLGLCSREIREVRYNQIKLCLYIKKDCLDYSEGYRARKYIKRSDNYDNQA